jgi:hypothetical protein
MRPALQKRGGDILFVYGLRKMKQPIKRKAAIKKPGKRRRSRRNQNAAPKGALVAHAHSSRIAAYAQRVMAPIFLADVARQLGCPNISPRDFYCGCAPCFKDGLPICEGRRDSCRFAHRWTPAKAAAQETPDHQSFYDLCWDIAMIRYCGKALPRRSMIRSRRR